MTKLLFHPDALQSCRALDLVAAGYYVYPTYGHRKYPLKISDHAHSWYWDNARLDKLAPAVALADKDPMVTGYALSPHKEDTYPLLLIDLDVYDGKTIEDLWEIMTDNEDDMPEGMGVTQSPSGGYHLWFSMPEHIDPRTLPSAFDMGSGMTGELRFTGQGGSRVLMLPHSRVMLRSGDVARYGVTDAFSLETLPDPPNSLLARLQGRGGTSADGNIDEKGHADQVAAGFKHPPTRNEIIESKLPTEVHHLLAILTYAEAPMGGRNNFVAMAAQNIGRIYTKRPNQVAINLIYRVIQDCLEEPLPKDEFMKTLFSGMKRGQINAKAHTVYDKHPSSTVVLTEARSIYGSLPWMVQYLESDGKIHSYELGLGMTAKTRHEPGNKSTTIHSWDARTVMDTLTRLSGGDLDIIVRSPIFIKPSWAKVLMHTVASTAEIEHISVDADTAFWDFVLEWAMAAATSGNFTEHISKRQPDDNFVAYTKVAIAAKGKVETARPVLFIHKRFHEFLLTQCGDLAAIKRLLRKFGDERKIYYKDRRTAAWGFELTEENVGADTMTYLEKTFLAWKATEVDNAATGVDNA